MRQSAKLCGLAALGAAGLVEGLRLGESIGLWDVFLLPSDIYCVWVLTAFLLGLAVVCDRWGNERPLKWGVRDARERAWEWLRWHRTELIYGDLIVIALLLPWWASTLGYRSVPHFHSWAMIAGGEGLFWLLARLARVPKADAISIQASKVYLLVVVPLGEWAGWWLRLWPYLLEETDPFAVWGHAYLEALTFAAVMINVALLYRYLWRVSPALAPSVLVFNIVFGWAADVFVNGFGTYAVTFGVWLVMETGYYLVLRAALRCR